MTRTALVKLPADAPDVRLGPPALLAAGGIRFTVSGPATAQYVIEASADLGSWLAFTNFTATNEVTTVVDAGTNNPAVRFYRARRLP